MSVWALCDWCWYNIVYTLGVNLLNMLRRTRPRACVTSFLQRRWVSKDIHWSSSTILPIRFTVTILSYRYTLLYQYFSVPSTSHSYHGLPCHTLTTRTFVDQTNLCSVLGGFDGNKLTKDVVSNVNHSQSRLYCCWHVCFTFDWLGWWLGKVIMALLSHSGLYPHHSHLQASLSFEPWLDVKAYWH